MTFPRFFSCLILAALLLGGSFSEAWAKPAHRAQPVAMTTTETAAPAEAVPEAHGGEHASEPGLPQFDPRFFPSQAFWLLLTFALTYLLMRYLALPQVENVLEGREKHIANDVATAKTQNERAKLLMGEYETRLAKARGDAQGVTRKVWEEGERKSATQLQDQTVKLNQQVKEAETRLGKMKETAQASLERQAEDVAAEIIKNVSGLTPTAAEIQQALHKARAA
jgi:F-type H+-transporting ATPase subunit b